ncbi:MAG TPA: limonene-1,2-epoxide hydrolase family protein [Mycobacteriales bacterium]
MDFLIVGLADPLAAASLARVSPDDVVGAFVAAIEAHDVDAAVSMMSEGISYENMPMAPISGRTGVASTLRGFLSPASTVDWRIVRQWTVDRTVINERLDRFQIGAGWLELPVVGIFEIDESDQIVLWRDYFDMNAYTSQFAELTGS